MKRNLGSSPAGRLGLILLMLISFAVGPGIVGCNNPEVQTAVWSGLNDLAVALVDALFLAFQPDTSTTTPVTTS